MPVSMLWRVSRPIRSRLRPPGFILPCQPALADRPPAGPGWLHEIKFDGYRVIARKDGERGGPGPRPITPRPSLAFVILSPRCPSRALCAMARPSCCAPIIRPISRPTLSPRQSEAILVTYDVHV